MTDNKTWFIPKRSDMATNSEEKKNKFPLFYVIAWFLSVHRHFYEAYNKNDTENKCGHITWLLLLYGIEEE